MDAHYKQMNSDVSVCRRPKMPGTNAGGLFQTTSEHFRLWLDAVKTVRESVAGPLSDNRGDL